jgi:hypothetical protein
VDSTCFRQEKIMVEHATETTTAPTEGSGEWIVPPDAKWAEFEVCGGQGGHGAKTSGSAGWGGGVKAVVPVRPGDHLTAVVAHWNNSRGGGHGFTSGGNGGDIPDLSTGHSGGGGGGSSAVLRNGQPVIVAGGGGGAGGGGPVAKGGGGGDGGNPPKAGTSGETMPDGEGGYGGAGAPSQWKQQNGRSGEGASKFGSGGGGGGGAGYAPNGYGGGGGGDAGTFSSAGGGGGAGASWVVDGASKKITKAWHGEGGSVKFVAWHK